MEIEDLSVKHEKVLEENKPDTKEPSRPPTTVDLDEESAGARALNETTDSNEQNNTTTPTSSNQSSRPLSPASPLSASEKVDPKDDENNTSSSITKSTVVITDSQLLDFNNLTSDKFVEVDTEDSNENPAPNADSNELNSQNLNYISSNNDSDSNNDSKEDHQNFEYVNEPSSSDPNVPEEEPAVSISAITTTTKEEENVVEPPVETKKEDEIEETVGDEAKEKKSVLEKQLSNEFTHVTSNDTVPQETKTEVAESNGHLSDDYEKDYEITQTETLKEHVEPLDLDINKRIDESRLN